MDPFTGAQWLGGGRARKHANNASCWLWTILPLFAINDLYEMWCVTVLLKQLLRSPALIWLVFVVSLEFNLSAFCSKCCTSGSFSWLPWKGGIVIIYGPAWITRGGGNPNVALTHWTSNLWTPALSRSIVQWFTHHLELSLAGHFTFGNSFCTPLPELGVTCSFPGSTGTWSAREFTASVGWVENTHAVHE